MASRQSLIEESYHRLTVLEHMEVYENEATGM